MMRNRLKGDSPGQQALHVDGKRSLVWRLLPVLALTAAAIVWLGWQFWTLREEAERIRSHDFRLMDLSARIVHLDEVLTMSARMAVATLDSSWEDRYRRYEPQLDEALKESSRLDPEIMGDFVAQTDMANQKLVEMENKAFDLVRRKDQSTAAALLDLNRQNDQSTAFAILYARANARMDAQRRRTVIVFVVLLCVMAVLSIFSAALLRTGKRRIAAEHQARQATEQAREGYRNRAEGDMPPANAFWSITMYDKDYFFVPNAINRYTVSSRNKFKVNADGSVDLYIQHDSPGKGKEQNWLPAPSDAFVLMMRLYWPSDKAPSILDGTWKPPQVKEVS